MSERVETRNPRLKEFESYRGNHFLFSSIQVREMRFIAHLNNLFSFFDSHKISFDNLSLKYSDFLMI